MHILRGGPDVFGNNNPRVSAEKNVMGGKSNFLAASLV